MNRQDTFISIFSKNGKRTAPQLSTSMLYRSVSLFSLFIIFCMVVITIYISVFNNVVFDTDHMFDFLFILGAAWRINQGLSPVAEFGYFYGGIIENVISQFMNIVARDVSVFHFTTLFILMLFSILTIIVFHARLSFLRISLVLLIITTLLLTRQPLEFPVTGSGLIATHSFIYNRVGLAALVVCGMFVSVTSLNRNSEFFAGVLLGALVAFTSLIKPTFSVLLFAMLFTLIFQSRRSAIYGFLLSILVVFLTVDPQLATLRGAIAYTSSHLASEPAAQLDYLLLRAIRIPLSESLAALLALAALCYVLRVPSSRRALIGTTIIALAGLGMTVTMGGAPGQLALPIAAFVGLAAAEWAERNQMTFRGPLQWLSVATVLSLALPHTANLLGVASVSQKYEDLLLIESGPYSRYVAIERTPIGAKRRPAYEMFADGIKLLSGIENVSKFGIVADQGITFEYAMLSRPVPGYPLWQRKNAPEFSPNKSPLEGVDIVMIGRKEIAISLREIFLDSMKSDFRACRGSEYWEIFVRRGLDISVCE